VVKGKVFVLEMFRITPKKYYLEFKFMLMAPRIYAVLVPDKLETFMADRYQFKEILYKELIRSV